MLKTLASRRTRDVLEKRFGLKPGGKKTLEAIGREYKITRERVRQIESDALKFLRKEESLAGAREALNSVADYIKNYGGVVAEHELFSGLGLGKFSPHLAFLLTVDRSFYKLGETEEFFNRWATDKSSASSGADIMTKVAATLKERGEPVPREVAVSLVKSTVEKFGGRTVDTEAAEYLLKTSKLIRRNPYGEYGLNFWPSINPRGVRDKAHLVLVKYAKPLHFTAVAKQIEAARFSKKKVNPQTVHNELIKDPRFILVGRGLYALREWGYEPGVVKDVMVSILKRSSSPLSREEIVRLVCEKRLVKPQTVLLNMQNKNLFRRTEDGKYTLV